MKLKSILPGLFFCSLLSCTNEVELPLDTTPRLNKTDSLTMVSFYNSTNGEYWNNLKWDLKNIQTWGGVTLMLHPEKNEYFVRELSIPDWVFPEGAVLPSDIGNLKYLNVFMIGGFKLGGEIPESLFDCPLKYLVIGGQKMHGEFPRGIKKVAKTLEFLCINHTQLSGELPEELYECTNLQYPLNLMNNKFTGEISVKLLQIHESIFLHKNNFTSLDWNFFKNGNSHVPGCSENRLAGEVPAWVLETDTWKNYEWSLSIQQDGYGLTY